MSELQIIGAGRSRTGTRSLHEALEILGYPTCHGFSVKSNKELTRAWLDVVEGKSPPDFGKLFHSYEAAVDVPMAAYYEEVLQAYPKIKVILTVRPADKWYISVMNSLFLFDSDWSRRINIFFSSVFDKLMESNIFPFTFVTEWEFHSLASKCCYVGFTNNFTDFGKKPQQAKYNYEEWNERVKRVVPAEQLLVFDVSQGWEPLCKFLGKPVPSIPFPNKNESARFLELLSLQRYQALVCVAGTAVFSAIAASLCLMYIKL